jgi:hypothetical protein
VSATRVRVTTADRSQATWEELASYQADLFHTCRHLGLLEADVKRLAEAITGRPWEDCGMDDVLVLVREIRQALRSTVAGRSAGGSS